MHAEDVRKSFGKLEVLKGVSLEVDEGRDRLHHRAVRLRQDDVHPLHQPPREDRRRPDRGQRPARSATGERDGKLVEDSERNIARQRTQIGMVFQRFNLFPHKTALENVIESPVHVLGEKKEQAVGLGTALLHASRAGGQARRLSRQALGRAAAAGGDRARARDGAGADAVRRADERARSRGDRRGALGDGGARRRRDDDDRRHARDGLRAKGGQPGRDDGRRADHRGGHARALLRVEPRHERTKQFLSQIL